MGNQEGSKKKFYKRWWFWVIVIFVLAIIGSSSDNKVEKVGENDLDSSVSQGEDRETPVVIKDQAFKIGDQVKMGYSIVTVNKIEYSQGGQITKPSEGNKWINLNVTLENTDSSQQYITTLGQMFIRDGEGNSYQVSVTDKFLENPGFGLDGQVIANSKRTGWVGFEILKDATALQFQYNDSMFGGDKILINLDR